MDNGTPVTQLSEKELLAQDLRTVDLMTRWRKKLSKGESIKTKVVDKGMMPTINIGDIAEVVPAQSTNLKTGHIIFFRQNDTFLIRRIIECIFSGTGEFKVKGDNQSDPEPKVAASHIIGKVIAIERDGERIELEKSFASALNKLQQKLNKNLGGPDTGKGKEIFKSGLNTAMTWVDKIAAGITGFIDKIVDKMQRR